jgi:hypothetical protein
MSDIEILFIAVGASVVILASVSAWIESRVTEREEPEHRKVLRKNSRYREHLSQRK